MNEDESTQTLSDKVVDRANVLRFAAPRRVSATERSSEPEAPAALSWTRWQGWVRGTGALAGQQRDIEGHVARIVELMRRLHRPIGHRLGRAIRSYVANYPHDGEHGDPRLPLADQVEMRLLPKLRGLETEAVSSELSDLVAFVRDDLGDVELAEALRESIDMSDQGTGQFVWRGVNRA